MGDADDAVVLRLLMDTCHQVMMELEMQANNPVQGEAMHKIMAGTVLADLRSMPDKGPLLRALGMKPLSQMMIEEPWVEP